MNPITNAKNQNLMNEKELMLGHTGTMSSWHRQYKDSAWIYVGGLNYELTEGDVICVFSQYGEIVNINLVRDKKTGRSKGFAFICYEDQRSTVLATDNLNGIKLAGRIIRVDHVEKYKVPKDGTVDVSAPGTDKKTEISTHNDMVADFVKEHGCGPEVIEQLEEIQKKQSDLDESRKRKKERDHHPHRSREPRDYKSNDNHRTRHHQDKHDSSRSYRNPSSSPPRTSKVKREAYDDSQEYVRRNSPSPPRRSHHRR